MLTVQLFAFHGPPVADLCIIMRRRPTCIHLLFSYTNIDYKPIKTNLYNHNTDVIANFARINTLKARRLVFDATFVYKILNV